MRRLLPKREEYFRHCIDDGLGLTHNEAAELFEELDALRSVLKFYADERNYIENYLDKDGQRARDALEGK